ncbi:B646L [African swine fever virus]|uniref:B646L n=1 Tax=African swine fever virus TaxID=10497 RepID=A0A5B8XAB1_ASF|nr:B646L [African swine fever virus]
MRFKTPDDPGAMMITFALKPREEYQPSGHINVSRAREFYISWDTDYVGSITTADLVVSASAINFLLLQNGSAVLRYST